jgi:serine/threonine protein kinase
MEQTLQNDLGLSPPCLHEPTLMEEPEFLHRADTEPIPGYRLIAPLGRGGFGEVWKCEAPGGLLKAIKFVEGGLHSLDQAAPAAEELRAIQRVKTIRHPFILSMERVEVGVATGELVIVFELADRSLADVLAAGREAGESGIARDVLLAYLREAAEALDVMHVRHGLQHLDIKPQNLFLVSNHVKVGDFGLVQSLGSAGGGGAGLGAITPLYASPEVFLDQISPHSDQYSLAIVYQELLTGTLPFDGKNSRQLLVQHSQAEPDLTALPEADRAVVARALAKEPARRFPSCSDFIHALAAGQTEVVRTTVVGNPVERVAAPDSDTRKTPVARTVRTRTLAGVQPPRGEAFAGLQVEDLVSRTPLSEVWNARAADGSPRQVKVLFGCAAPGCVAIARLTTLRHPALLPIDVLQHAPGKLVLAAPAGDGTLRDALVQQQAQGRSGIPREQLLAWLRSAAETLHALDSEHHLNHLGLNPRTLVLDGERLLLADFGLAQLVWLPTGQSVGQLNGRYSAPELQARRLDASTLAGRACDQYSLALIYHEMLTGTVPPYASVRRGEPASHDLFRLPVADRVLVARALHPDPGKRWPNAVELISALQQVSSSWNAGDRGQEPGVGTEARADDCLRLCFGSNLGAEVIRHRLEGFQQQWSARVLASDQQGLLLHMQTPRSFWQRWTGQQSGLEVRLQVGQPEIAAPDGVQVRTEVRMEIRPHGARSAQADELLNVVGPLLVESVRQHLAVPRHGRQQERLSWHHPLQLCPIEPDGSLGPAIECQGKDISLNGIGFYLPGQLPSAHVLLHLPQTPQTPKMSVPVRVVRVQGCGDGWFEVGAILQTPAEGSADEAAVQEASAPVGQPV